MFSHRAWALLLCGLWSASNGLALATDAEETDATQSDDLNPEQANTKPKRANATSAAWRSAQRTALRKMRSKKDEHRYEAFDELKQFPTLECAKLLVLQGMKSPFEEVRKDAYATLASFRDSQEVCDYLLTSVEKDSSRAMPSETTCALLAVPLSSDTPEITKKAFQLLDKAAAQRKGGMLLLVLLADTLGAQADETSVKTLAKIAQRPMVNEHFAVRRAVVQALVKTEEKEAIDALIDLLAKVEGEVRGDIVRHLAAISGENFGLAARAWEQWWKSHRADFRFGAVAAKAVNRAEAVRSMAAYHGLPIYAARMIFVIDTSGSMRGEPMLAAKQELIASINALPEGVYFNVLAFDRDVKPWQRKLAIASPAHKKQASLWISSQGMGGGTASFDALEAALDQDTEAIYFLTDGAPYGGKVTDPPEIVDIISRLNFTRRISINSIGFGAARQIPADFLTTLASRNYGEYRAVEFGK